MNKEHFLTLLKIKLKPLGPGKMQVVLSDYEERFDALLATGLTEPLASKQLGDPEEIAQEILEEQEIFTDTTVEDSDDWQEINDSSAQSEDPHSTTNPSFFIRFCQVAGIIALNALFMIWVIFTGILCVLSGWLVVIVCLFSPIIGLVAFSLTGGTGGLFQLFLSIALCGLGFIGLSIAIPVTKYAWLFIQKYFLWNIHVLRGDY